MYEDMGGWYNMREAEDGEEAPFITIMLPNGMVRTRKALIVCIGVDETNIPEMLEVVKQAREEGKEPATTVLSGKFEGPGLQIWNELNVMMHLAQSRLMKSAEKILGGGEG